FYRHRRNFHPAVTGRDYAGVVSRSRISLGFVSSSNGDEYTMRTFEIPACGGFLLAERTPTHQELFTEGKEAEFFSSTEECAEKIRFYLERESVRMKIAERGYQRCLESDYSLRRRMDEAIEGIQTPKEHAPVHF
ncbi:MAG TPA: glycosyltransferase, partial [Verrucomicrobiae bacterium]|nr:glycosyltransferase [Verrucomicrobiae bacterium]